MTRQRFEITRDCKNDQSYSKRSRAKLKRFEKFFFRKIQEEVAEGA